MPTPEEIAALTGDNQIENPVTPEEPAVVPREEYEKVVNQYDNIRSLESRRDNELHDLREKVKKYENDKEEEQAPDSKVVFEDDEEDEVLKARIKKLGFVPQDEVDKQVERQLKLKERVETLQNQMKDTISKMPFVKESDVLSFIKGKGDLTVEQAIQLLYPKELESYNRSKTNEEVVETDNGGRTLNIRPTISKNDDVPTRQGFGKQSFSNFLSNRLEKNVQEAAGRS